MKEKRPLKRKNTKLLELVTPEEMKARWKANKRVRKVGKYLKKPTSLLNKVTPHIVESAVVVEHEKVKKDSEEDEGKFIDIDTVGYDSRQCTVISSSSDDEDYNENNSEIEKVEEEKEEQAEKDEEKENEVKFGANAPVDMTVDLANIKVIVSTRLPL